MLLDRTPSPGTIGLELAQRFAHTLSTAPPISPPARQLVTAAVAELVVFGSVDLLRLLEDLRGQLAARLVRRGNASAVIFVPSIATSPTSTSPA